MLTSRMLYEAAADFDIVNSCVYQIMPRTVCCTCIMIMYDSFCGISANSVLYVIAD